MKLTTSLVILVLLALVSCKQTEWLPEIPDDIHGAWVESDETWPGSMEVRQELVLSAQAVRWLANEDGFIDLPVAQVSVSGNKWIVFCGARNEDYIANTRLSLIQRSDGRLLVKEIVPTGWSGPGVEPDEIFAVGVFRRK